MKLDEIYRGAKILLDILEHIEKNFIRSGVCLLEIDQEIGKYLAEHNCVSAPKKDYNFPGYSCISMNDCATHGVPYRYKLVRGDMIKVDISFKYADVHYFDSARTWIVERKIDDIQDIMMIAFTQNIIALAIEELQSRLDQGGKIYYQDFGKLFYKMIKNTNYAVIEMYGGHRIGVDRIHEEPYIPNIYEDNDPEIEIKENDIFCIEPLITYRTNNKIIAPIYHKGRWNVHTRSGLRCAHYERMIMLHSSKLIALT